MHLIQPQLSPIEAPGSAYVVGRYGSLMSTTYFALAAALISPSLGLAINTEATVLMRLARVTFLIAAAGAVLAGIFPMDYPPPPRTTSGRLHVAGGALTFIPWVIGTLLFSLSMRRSRRWGGSGTLLTLAVVSVGLAAVLPLSVRLGFPGAAQRVLLAFLFSWLLVVAVHLMQRNESS